MIKKHLKDLAIELRAELGTGPFDIFNPYALAKLYGVPVVHLNDLNCSAAAKEYFAGAGVSALSGALIPLQDGSAIILENAAHAPERRRATISHELAHLILEHRFDTRLVDQRGCRVADGEQEQEAAELGAELLLPAVAALARARRQASDEDVAAAFGVSVELAAWRLNGTGARKRADRERRRRLEH
ncbi:ImmA/IrrE family metallo-endopeptidase [uncultured Pseudokineococcus sp.]|uniref:ImmA/IrrE family metallo-endopeptidase n=1 Tax=uncultured Pseudokineococcus sp. TaxID=1642928 RepID=UPI00261AA867|nr:ImmA/IrrE family metallo-endopeptidase [uncultured Pseudokineococcus sp.]